MKNIKEIRLSGSGGQGLITAGIILAKAAVLDNYNVTQTQSYGPESRGGASRADVIIGNTKFYFPEATNFDYLIALTQESYDKYTKNIKEAATLIVDTTNVKNTTILNAKSYELPLSKITNQKLGTILPTNIVALAFLVKVTKIVTQVSLKKAVCESMKKEYIDLNKKAIRLGFRLARKEMED